MKLFVFKHGRFRRIGLEHADRLTGQTRRTDLTRVWHAWTRDTRQDLPSFPDLDDLIRGRMLNAITIERCREYFDTLSGRERDQLEITGPIEWGAPVKRPGKILAMAKNYAAHAAEMGGTPPPTPTMFAKLPSSVTAHDKPIVLPVRAPGRVEHEAELAILIGEKVQQRTLKRETALSVVAGFTIANDVTHRDLQTQAKAAGMPWTMSKGFDTFCPLGPYLVLREHFDPRDRAIECRVNDQVRQQGSTALMVHDVPAIVVAANELATLDPGDVILTGTPSGVGPLVPGDVVSVTIDGIGTLTNRVEAAAE